MEDEKKVPKCRLQCNYLTYHMPTPQKGATGYCFHLCYMRVTDSKIVECYLHIKDKETYVKVTTFSEFAPWQI